LGVSRTALWQVALAFGNRGDFFTARDFSVMVRSLSIARVQARGFYVQKRLNLKCRESSALGIMLDDGYAALCFADRFFFGRVALPAAAFGVALLSLEVLSMAILLR